METARRRQEVPQEELPLDLEGVVEEHVVGHIDPGVHGSGNGLAEMSGFHTGFGVLARMLSFALAKTGDGAAQWVPSTCSWKSSSRLTRTHQDELIWATITPPSSSKVV